jgi:hypothetical protein
MLMVSRCNSIGSECLLSEIHCTYIDSSPPGPSPPEDHLYTVRVRMLGDGQEIKLLKPSRADKPIKYTRSFFGAFVITNFQLSTNLDLRVLGARSPAAFLRAIQYFGLWNINASGREVLTRPWAGARSGQHGPQVPAPANAQALDGGGGHASLI